MKGGAGEQARTENISSLAWRRGEKRDIGGFLAVAGAKRVIIISKAAPAAGKHQASVMRIAVCAGQHRHALFVYERGRQQTGINSSHKTTSASCRRA